MRDSGLVRLPRSGSIAQDRLRALLLVALILAALAAAACARNPSPELGSQPAAADEPRKNGLEQRAPAPRVQGARAIEYVRDVVGLGPRPVASRAHQRMEAYLRSHLRGDELEEDAFTAQTPAGQLPMRNLIAKYPGAKDGIIVIATHYDTLYPLRNFVGANDGGSGAGLLLELANHLRSPGRKRNGYAVWLVWLDGEEAIRQWSASDSLYGSRHLAERWRQNGAARKIKAFLLLDMIGYADLNIDRDSNSTPWLLDLVRQAAQSLGYQSHFYRRDIAIEDDHLPFARIGVPVADLIDFEYGYNNVFHHTTEDTLDKLSPRSLEIVGDVVLETVRRLESSIQHSAVSTRRPH